MLLFTGTIAGVIIMIVGGGLVPLIGEQMDEVLKNRLLPPLSLGAMIFFVFVSLSHGFGVTGLYILLESTTKSRSRAVIITTIAFWFWAYALSSGALVAYGFMPLKLTVLGTTWGILEIFAGTIAVSCLYKTEI